MPTTSPVRDVPHDRMQEAYETMKTPRKRGIILHPPEGGLDDCPIVFRSNTRFYMLYVDARNNVRYETKLAVTNDMRRDETKLAVSDDLLKWEPLGTVLPFRNDGWDHWQADGGIALIDTEWGGTMAPQQFDGKYWMSYLGGALQGYETDPLSIGIAWTTT